VGQFTLVSKPFPKLEGSHNGAGWISSSEHVADPASVVADVSVPFEMPFWPYHIRVLSLEIEEEVAPNWFGVAFPKGITKFDTVNIFCHPHPGNAGMDDSSYPKRSGNWPKLFRYAELFGRQMAMAKTNHITVVPFFSNHSYGDTGIFGRNWLDLVEQIIVHAKNASREAAAAEAAVDGRHGGFTPAKRLVIEEHVKKGSRPSPRTSSSQLSHVVLSCFSRGRALLATVRAQSPGMNSFLREVWDFDGVGGAIPSAPRVITYDQHKTRGTIEHIHCPPERFVNYHHSVVANAHGDIPARMACHAATVSRVGK